MSLLANAVPIWQAGKKINIESMKISLVFVVLLMGCTNDFRTTNPTPVRYTYRIKQDSNGYSNDTSIVRLVLKKMLHDKVRPFHWKGYYGSQRLIIDSLVYSPDKMRMIVLVIVERSKFSHDAYYLFCSRVAPAEPIKIYDYFGFSLGDFKNELDIREALREYCFTRMLKLDGNEAHYNLDDVRFWTSKEFEWVLKNSLATGQ